MACVIKEMETTFVYGGKIEIDMKAMVLHGIGDLRLMDVARPQPKGHEVLVAVKAAGICGSDIARIYRTGAYAYPLVPGHEFAGIVVQAGEKVNERWLGRRVGVFPLVPCGDCRPCRERKYEMCRNYGYLGSRQNGGFAEYAAVPEANLLRMPDGVPFEEAAMMEPMAVAVHAMRVAAPQAGQFVVICGLGTIGLLLLAFLREAGVCGAQNIAVIGKKAFQKQLAMELGVPGDCYCDGSAEDAGAWIMEHTNGAGADVFFECVGKNETLALAVDCAAPGANVVLVGNPYSDMTLEQNVYWKILRNQLTVRGTWNSSFLHSPHDDWHYVAQKLSERSIEPAKLITHRFAMEELGEGFALMRDKTQDYVKVMGIW